MFQEITSFILKYNTTPTPDALKIEINSIRGSTDDTIKKIIEQIDEFGKDTTKTNMDWLIDSTEKFCQDRAIYNAITESLEIMNGKGTLQKGAIPDLLTKALSISFDPNVGHDYLEQSDERYHYYHKIEDKLKFDLEFFNKITKNGVPRITLNVLMAGVGVGKSLFLCHLAANYLNQGKKIGIVAIDPTSPFSGGAILGDRIRMNDLTLNENVFIRSMRTRGSLGGLSKKTADVVKLMDAFGMDLVIIETVGVGQSEVDIVKNADTTLVVLVPGLGDDIQAIKAGILEIGDVFAINKADRDGCDRLNVEIEMMLDLDSREVKWRPPIKRTIASKDQGVDELIDALDEHFEYLEDSGELESRRAERTRDEIIAMINEQIGRYVADKIVTSDEFNSQVAAVNERESDPYTVVNGVMTSVLK